MADFWASLSPYLTAGTFGCFAWVVRVHLAIQGQLAAIQTKQAVIETRLKHLEAEHDGR